MPTDAELLGRWPQVVLDQAASKSLVLVLGAGVSKNAVNGAGDTPPTWLTLLDQLTDVFATQGHKTYARKLVKQGKLLEAAELLRGLAIEQGKEQDFLEQIIRSVDGPIADPFQPATIHNAILDLNPFTIVTTNYDRVLERAAGTGYSYLSAKSDEIGRSVRVGRPIVIQMHGVVTEPPSIVLGRSDYTTLRRSGAHAFEVVEALFMTRTALFIGYSLSDPDIQLLLENVLGGREGPGSHYILTPRLRPHEAQLLGYCYGLAPIQYQDTSEVTRMMELLGGAIGVGIL
jgi:hypothetical protein